MYPITFLLNYLAVLHYMSLSLPMAIPQLYWWPCGSIHARSLYPPCWSVPFLLCLILIRIFLFGKGQCVWWWWFFIYFYFFTLSVSQSLGVVLCVLIYGFKLCELFFLWMPCDAIGGFLRTPSVGVIHPFLHCDYSCITWSIGIIDSGKGQYCRLGDLLIVSSTAAVASNTTQTKHRFFCARKSFFFVCLEYVSIVFFYNSTAGHTLMHISLGFQINMLILYILNCERKVILEHQAAIGKLPSPPCFWRRTLRDYYICVSI